MTTTYTVLELNGHARHYLVHMCDTCGALVHARAVHDSWHRCVDPPLVDPVGMSARSRARDAIDVEAGARAPGDGSRWS